MLLYPKAYFESVKEISYSFLKEKNIKAIILDVDNTILDFDRKIPEGIETWCKDLKNKNIKFCILSNSNKKEKVQMVAQKLDVPYFYLGLKPLKKGFKKAINELEENKENIAAIGDQIFTDIVGANRCKLFAILVKPIKEEKDYLVTKIKRPIEKYIIKRYKRRKEE